mgnify:CR=1 FL=1
MDIYSDAKRGSVNVGVGILFRFANEMREGDYAIFPSKSDWIINIGIVGNDYKYDANESEFFIAA